jgi:hypothetical protein
VLYDSSGVPGVAIGEMRVDFADDAGAFTTSAVAVTRPAFFTDKVRFVGTTVANASGAEFAQATVLAPFKTPFQTAALWPTDQRVLTLMGGAGDPTIPSFAAGVGATTCVFDDAVNGDTTVAGEPLFISDIAVGSTPKVSRQGTQDKLIGLSAGATTVLAGQRIVPVAMAGMLRVVVEHTGGSLPAGVALSAATTSGHLQQAASGQFVIARAAQRVDSAGSASAIFAWVVHPPYKHF